MQSKAEFLAAFQRKAVEITAEGVKLFIRPLSPEDIRTINAQPEGALRTAFALVRSVCDSAGSRILTDDDAASVNDLIPHTASEEILGEVARVNRLGDHAKKAPSPEKTN